MKKLILIGLLTFLVGCGKDDDNNNNNNDDTITNTPKANFGFDSYVFKNESSSKLSIFLTGSDEPVALLVAKEGNEVPCQVVNLVSNQKQPGNEFEVFIGVGDDKKKCKNCGTLNSLRVNSYTIKGKDDAFSLSQSKVEEATCK